MKNTKYWNQWKEEKNENFINKFSVKKLRSIKIMIKKSWSKYIC